MPVGFYARVIAAAVYAAAAAPAAFAATYEQRSSILIFPRVVADEQHDTRIQLVNSSFLIAYASCFYVGTTGGPETLTRIDLDLRLAAQQTTHWSAARGRPVDPTDPACTSNIRGCDNAGFDPGEIPPLPANFEGQLVCVQVDASGAPWSGNALMGVARIFDTQSADVETFAAIGLRGFDTNDGNADLCLGGEPRALCPKGAEYDACLSRAFATHPTDAPNGDAPGTATFMTIVPCNLDLGRFVPPDLTMTFRITNELEQTLSASTTVKAYSSLPLGEISVVFNRDVIGGDLVKTTLRSVGTRGFVGISRITQTTGDGAATAVRLHGDPTQPASSVIRLPD